jgi:hypothetical protein
MLTEATSPALSCDDIFPTPKNDPFYATKPYSALDATEKEIRLLRILPADRSGDIKCTLLPGRSLVQTKGRYSALSYCAGDPKITSPILVNGVRFNAFANLRHALGEVRNFWDRKYKDEPRDLLLWTDQVCIDQKNSQERSHQVGFMRDVYEQAEQVLVCLSTSTTSYNSRKGMDWLLELAAAVPPLDSDLPPYQERPQHTYKANNDHVSRDGGQARLDRSHFARLQKYMWNRLSTEKFTSGWLAFYDVIGSPWWSRAWIFQEFLVARELHLLCRRRFVAWKTILPILRSLLPMHRFLDAYLYELNDDFVLNSIAHRNTDRIRDRIDACGYKLLMNTVNFMVDSRDDWTGQMKIRDLLTHARFCNTTDLRDKVFAFIGLGDPEYGIVPNYSSSLNQILMETTRKIIDHEDSLDILTYAVLPQERQRLSLPSWVVDWTRKELGVHRNNDYGSVNFQKMNGLPKERPEASFVSSPSASRIADSLALAVWGVFLGTLTTDISDPSTPQQHELSRTFVTEEDVPYLCSSATRHRDEVWFVQGLRSLLVLRSKRDNYVMVSAALAVPLQGLTVDFVREGERQQGGRKRILII